MSIGPILQHSKKTSQLSSSVFRTVQIILPIQQPNLSPSVSTTNMQMIKPLTTPIMYPTQ